MTIKQALVLAGVSLLLIMTMVMIISYSRADDNFTKIAAPAVSLVMATEPTTLREGLCSEVFMTPNGYFANCSVDSYLARQDGRDGVNYVSIGIYKTFEDARRNAGVGQVGLVGFVFLTYDSNDRVHTIKLTRRANFLALE